MPETPPPNSPMRIGVPGMANGADSGRWAFAGTLEEVDGDAFDGGGEAAAVVDGPTDGVEPVGETAGRTPATTAATKVGAAVAGLAAVADFAAVAGLASVAGLAAVRFGLAGARSSGLTGGATGVDTGDGLTRGFGLGFGFPGGFEFGWSR